MNPLQSAGLQATRRRLAEWVASFHSPIGYELRDLSIMAGEDGAFCHSLNRVDATTTDGTKLDMWWRTTVCCRCIDSAWKITHASVPFDVASGKASLDLEP